MSLCSTNEGSSAATLIHTPSNVQAHMRMNIANSSFWFTDNWVFPRPGNILLRMKTLTSATLSAFLRPERWLKWGGSFYQMCRTPLCERQTKFLLLFQGMSSKLLEKQVKSVISWGVLLINCCKLWFRDSARQGGQEVPPPPPARELWIKLLSSRIPTCSPPCLRGGGDPWSIVAEMCVVQPRIFLQERGGGGIEADCSGFSFPHCFPGPWCGGGGNMGTMCNQVFFSLASQWPMKWYRKDKIWTCKGSGSPRFLINR